MQFLQTQSSRELPVLSAQLLLYGWTRIITVWPSPLFKLKRDTRQTMSPSWRASMLREEIITLTCIGRSTQPIKDLIKECRDYSLDREKSYTIVRRPASKDFRARGHSVWHKVAVRPSRPIETVVLDHDEKNRVLGDINEYLHPSTSRWYANRCIPYRRGYLFAGPPGTGKSSLAWAIAGVFGIDIYCISLVEPTHRGGFGAYVYYFATSLCGAP